MSLLSVQNLSITLPDGKRLVDDVTFALPAGATIGVVGESGSGKSLTAYSLLQLLRDRGLQCSGSILWEGQNLVTADEPTLQRLRGRDIAMIFQEPMSALNPLHTIHRQIAEAITLHQPLGRSEIAGRVAQLLAQVGLAEQAERLACSYPHQLSGGQRQRVMIAMAIANTPKILVADEPTTALDVTTQTHILDLLRGIQRQHGMGLILISHDVPMVRRLADHIYVMQHGRIIEHNTTARLFARPQHPYTKLLLKTDLPVTPVTVPEAPSSVPIYQANSVHVRYPISHSFWGKPLSFTHAVNDVSFTLDAGKTLGIVGESGSGKSTLAMALLRLQAATGTRLFDQMRLDTLPAAALRPLRRHMQLVLQDPFNALSPRLTVGQIIGEGLAVHEPRLKTAERHARVTEALRTVGLSLDDQHRYPHAFSGGQRQRIAIARAVILQPRLIILDEPTSALDVATQRQIVDLLRQLQQDKGLSYIIISHDLRVIRALSHSLMVMKDGCVVEQGTASALLSAPQHPYTKTLLAAAEII